MTKELRDDEYWQMSTYYYSSHFKKAELIAALADSGMVKHKHMSKDELVRHAERFDRGLLNYRNYQPEDLHKMKKDRKLKKPRGVKDVTYFDLLEDADEDLTFDYFLDLPDEIRNRIVHYYCRSFTDPSWSTRLARISVKYRPKLSNGQPASPSLQTPTQPPLSMVNRQLRKEVLPVFYHETKFDIDFHFTKDPKDTTKIKYKRVLEDNFRLDRYTLEWLETLPDEAWNNIHRFKVKLNGGSRSENRDGLVFMVDVDSMDERKPGVEGCSFDVSPQWPNIAARGLTLVNNIVQQINDVPKVNGRRPFSLDLVGQFAGALAFGLE